MGVSQNQGYRFWSPNNKDYSILGSIFGGFPILGNYHIHGGMDGWMDGWMDG